MQELWNNYKRYKIQILCVAEEEREKGTKIVEEIITEQFP